MDLDSYLESLMNPEYVPKFPFSLFYSEGSKYLRMRLYKKALERLDEALMDEPSNVKALLTRAKVHIYMRQYEKAKEDATEAVKLWPGYSEAFDLKGRSEFMMGDFEGAYLTYLAGREVRPDIEKLRLGQQLCEESMKNSMKIMSGFKVDRDDIYLMSKVKDGGVRFAQRSSNRLPNYERFSKDKKILQELLLDEDVKNVHGLCKESLDDIHQFERFWAMQKPLHCRKKAPARNKRITKKGTILQLMTSMKNRCQDYLRNDNLDLCIADGEKLMRLMESYSGAPTERSIKLKAEIYHLMSFAYDEKKDDKLCLDFLQKELEISQKSEYIHPQIRAFHHLGIYYMRKRDYQSACSSFLGVTEALKPDRLKKYLEDRERHVIEDETKDEKHKDLAEIEAAEIWARNFKQRLTALLPQSAINNLLLEIRQEDMCLLNLGHNISRSESESSKTETYLTADDSIRSVISSDFGG
ncbi:outer dynein arm-docking complex subunit 4-like [Argiope bruennichi]|uniref:outer dynein arm-docking complex subunit 4-like n=1 Tax=Argiope bruennichi TaxID=94029 RepID=UPI00249410D8|nr:outer dynein arm-docking complex subunit 4-like [Argiope bruennichi]